MAKIFPVCLLIVKQTEHHKNKVFKSTKKFNSLKIGNTIFAI